MAEEIEETLDPDDRIAQAAREAAPRFALDPDDFARRVIAARDRRRERAARPFKRCGTCREYLPARSFAENTREPDGLQTNCKRCDAGRQRARRVASGDTGA